MNARQFFRFASVAALSLILWGCAGAPQTRPTTGSAPPARIARELGALAKEQGEIKSDLSEVSNRMEEIQRRMAAAESLSKQNAKLLSDLAASVEKMSAYMAAKETPEAAEEAKPEEAPAGEVGALSLPKLYTAAYESFKGEDYADAVERFTRFVERFPRSRLADNAQFYIGESLFRMNDLPGALSAYEKVEVNFPSGNRVPDALYKKGIVYLETGDLSSAIVELKRTAMSFPRDEAAQKAKEKLWELGLSPQP